MFWAGDDVQWIGPDDFCVEGVRCDSTTIFPSSFTPDQRTQKGMIEIKKGTLYEMLLREERIKSITNKYNTPFKEVN